MNVSDYLWLLTGEPLPEDQDPGRLLLLRVRAARGQSRPRPLLRGDGAGHDRGHFVSCTPPTPMFAGGLESK